MTPFPRRLAGCFLLALSLSACGEEAQSLPPEATEALNPVGKPWESIPADSLYGATPAENLVATQVELDLLSIPEGWEGMRIAALSDFQLGLWEGNDSVAIAATRRVARLDADLVVLLGDYIAQGIDTLALGRVLAPLRGRPVLAVLGDRDLRTDSIGAAISRTLGRQGIRVLKNGSVPFVHNNDTAYIAGVDPELADEPAGDQSWVLSQLGGGGRPGLLLSHSPLLASRAPANRFPGMIAGGTFCGRVEVPGTPRLSWLNETGLPGAVVSGVPRLYRLSRSVMFVTCGLGYTFVPIRFGAAPEIAMITLHRSGVRPPEEPGIEADSMSIDTLLRRFQQDTAGADPAR